MQKYEPVDYSPDLLSPRFCDPCRGRGALSLTWSTILGGSEADYAHEVQQRATAGTSRWHTCRTTVMWTKPWLGGHLVVKLDGAGSRSGTRPSVGAIEILPTPCSRRATVGVVAGSTRSNDGDVGFNHGLRTPAVKLDGAGRKVWNVPWREDMFCLRRAADERRGVCRRRVYPVERRRCRTQPWRIRFLGGETGWCREARLEHDLRREQG